MGQVFPKIAAVELPLNFKGCISSNEIKYNTKKKTLTDFSRI